MYKRANSEITGGLSFGARLLLGLMATLFGFVMLFTAPTSEPRVFWFYAFGVFCLLIAVASFTSGRVRQFVGSLIGCSIFLVGVAYLAAEFYGGVLWSDSRANPSLYNAAKYLVFIGIPGVVYAYKVRFGFRRVP